jgi:hypothetical protein
VKVKCTIPRQIGCGASPPCNARYWAHRSPAVVVNLFISWTRADDARTGYEEMTPNRPPACFSPAT